MLQSTLTSHAIALLAWTLKVARQSSAFESLLADKLFADGYVIESYKISWSLQTQNGFFLIEFTELLLLLPCTEPLSSLEWWSYPSLKKYTYHGRKKAAAH